MAARLVVAAHLGGHDSLTLDELSGALDSPAETVEDRLSGLTGPGLVARMVPPELAAPHRFRLTDEGRALFERQRSDDVSGLASVLSRWDDGDVAALIGYLGRLSDGIDGENRRLVSAGAVAAAR